MLLRGMVIYFFMSFFRRPQPTQQPGAPGADGTAMLPKGAATNLFENGTLFVSYEYWGGLYYRERVCLDDNRLVLGRDGVSKACDIMHKIILLLGSLRLSV